MFDAARDEIGTARGSVERWNMMPSDFAFTWSTEVRFDPALIKRLVARHAALGCHFTVLAQQLKIKPEAAWCMAHDCARQLHELRRDEALWLYPFVARELAGDPIASRRFAQLRLVLNGLARRLLRRIEQLARAARLEAKTGLAAESAAIAMAQYRQRNETELYTLYGFIGTRAPTTGVLQFKQTRQHRVYAPK